MTVNQMNSLLTLGGRDENNACSNATCFFPEYLKFNILKQKALSW